MISLVLALALMQMKAPTEWGVPPPPKTPHRQIIQLDPQSKLSEDKGKGVTFHDNPGDMKPAPIGKNEIFSNSPDGVGDLHNKVNFVDRGEMSPIPIGSQLQETGPYTYQMTELYDDATTPTLVVSPRTYLGAVDVDSPTGRVVKLSNAEYERLHKLRQAVEDAENDIAKAHGVKAFIGSDCTPPPNSIFVTCNMGTYTPPDRFEFRGQFLLINVPPTKKEKE